jgi:hypothetical protein
MLVALWELVYGHGKAVSRLTRSALLGLTGAAGFIAFQIYLSYRYGHPELFLASHLSRVRSVVWDSVTSAPSGQQGHVRLRMFDGLLPAPLDKVFSFGAWCRFFIALIVVLAVVGLLRPGRIPRAAFALPLFIAALGWWCGTSLARFETAALPCFLLVASWLVPSHRRLGFAVVSGSLAFELLFAVGFARGTWMG